MITLEEEFEKYKARHKYKILKTMIYRYYESLLSAGCLDVADFKLIDELANNDIIDLILRNDNLIKFNKLYEIAYNELAENAEF